MSSLCLLPMPRTMRVASDRWTLPAKVFVVLESHPAARDLFAAERFADEVQALTGTPFSVCVCDVPLDPSVEIRASYDPAAGNGQAQGYRLVIAKSGVELAASTPAGIFYAFQTLLQIIRHEAYGGRSPSKGKGRSAFSLPCVTIDDYPDFPRRGVYHDCARGKVPTVETLLQLIDDLAHLKCNEFQLYIENTFEFRKYPQMYDDTTTLTAEDLLQLDAACRVRHMDFVPSLTSLGHFDKILSRPAFRHLAEAEPEQLKAIGAPCWVEQPWSLCVTDPEARQLLADMYAEFLPNFTSAQFNICCDEAYDLGRVRSKELADKIGTGQMYVDWIGHCAELARRNGKSIQMWGDIILHHPELIAQLPEDAVLLEWGYEADHKFEEHCAIFAERLKTPAKGGNQRFYVCPGTSSWLTLASRSKNALGNIHAAADAGLKHEAEGILITDWGDNGHQQLLAVSMTALGYGAAAGWNVAAAGSAREEISDLRFERSELLKGISWHLFKDRMGKAARLAYELGLTYERFTWKRFNASLEWYLLREKWDFANYVNRATKEDLPRVSAACERIGQELNALELLRADGELIVKELAFTCEEIVHTCMRTVLRKAWLAADPAKRNPEEPSLRDKRPEPLPKSFRKQMLEMAADAKRLEREFKRLWLARNKPSRVEDVLGEFRRLAKEYREFSR